LTGSPEKSQGSRPKCLALILCDLCIQDRKTKNKTLVGLFNGIVVAGIPAVFPRMTIVFTLVDGRGKVPVNVTIRDLSSDQKIFDAPGTAEFKDPLGELDVVIELRNVPFRRLGEYVVEVVAAGELLGSRRFSVRLVEGQPK